MPAEQPTRKPRRGVKPSGNTHLVQVRISPAIRQRVVRVAMHRKVSVSEYLRTAILTRLPEDEKGIPSSFKGLVVVK